jgi:hypothetical protein
MLAAQFVSEFAGFLNISSCKRMQDMLLLPPVQHLQMLQKRSRETHPCARCLATQMPSAIASLL